MKSAYSIDFIDFHQGWLIEVTTSDHSLDHSVENTAGHNLKNGTQNVETPKKTNFKIICYSPCRKQLVLQQSCYSKFDALFAAQHMIDYQIACDSLLQPLREFYEAGQLDIDDWSSLQHSLQYQPEAA